MEKDKKIKLKNLLIQILITLLLAFIHFAYFTFTNNLFQSGFDGVTLSFVKTGRIFVELAGGIFVVYFLGFLTSFVIADQYLFLLKKKIVKIPFLATNIIYLLLTYFFAFSFLIRQSIYSPGFIESGILKRSVPVLSRDNLIFLTSSCSLKQIDVFLLLFVIIIPIMLLLIRYFEILRTLVINRKYTAIVAASIMFVTILAINIMSAKSVSNKNRPNIVFIGIDSLRPDRLSYNGYDKKTSPYLDSFLKKSILFSNAFTTLARTSPSIASLLTSFNPNIHGIRHMFPRSEDRNLHVPTLVNILRENNYITSVYADYAGDIFDNINFGFEYKDVPKGFSYYSILSMNIINQHPVAISFLWGKLAELFVDGKRFLPIGSDPRMIFDKVKKNIANLKNSDKNFFITSFVSSVHVPYNITYPYYNNWVLPGYLGTNRFAYSKQELGDLLLKDKKVRGIESTQINLLYDQAIFLTDDAIGEFLTWMEKSKILENTIIVFFSDHGENLPKINSGDTRVEHGTFLNKNNDDLKMFLALYLPKKIMSQYHLTPQKISERVRITDIMPTILSLLNIPFANGTGGSVDTSGISLLPLLQGQKEKFLDLPVFVENGLSFNSKEDYKNSGAGNGLAITYPDIFHLLEIEDDFPYYLTIKKEYILPVFQAKWRKLLKNNSSLIYIPKNETGGSFEFFGSSVPQKSVMNEDKNELKGYMLQEAATIFNGSDLIEYKN
ncbi:MAG: sulfatase-like hydrolase/transferase [Oligoflexia bacterium]|nr:sulfatase-like hydrolase/transferase [Oligoflexia bacterium]